jgi:hypothetical protein
MMTYVLGLRITACEVLDSEIATTVCGTCDPEEIGAALNINTPTDRVKLADWTNNAACFGIHGDCVAIDWSVRQCPGGKANNQKDLYTKACTSVNFCANVGGDSSRGIERTHLPTCVAIIVFRIKICDALSERVLEPGKDPGKGFGTQKGSWKGFLL